MIEILVFLFSMVIHEFGHYLAFIFFGVKPKVRIKWWGVLIGSGEVMENLTLKQNIFVFYTGIYVGFLFLFIMSVFVPIPQTYFLIYIIISYIDIRGMHDMFSLKKYGFDKRLKDVFDEYYFDKLLERIELRNLEVYKKRVMRE